MQVLYSEKIISAVANVVEEHSDRVVRVVSLSVLKQGANVFGLEILMKVVNSLSPKKDHAKLQHAPMNNIAAERHVGSFQHVVSSWGLSIGCCKQQHCKGKVN